MRVQDDPITSDSHWLRSPLYGLTEVTASAQITLPAARRRQFNLSEEAYLEAEAAADGTLLKPVVMVECTKVREQFLKVMGRVHA